MRKFTYTLISPDGVRVQYTTEQKKASDLIEKHDTLVSWFEKNGWMVEKANKPTLESTTQSEKHFCGNCGAEMQFKSGTSKAGKPWKGYFCPTKGHDPVWI